MKLSKDTVAILKNFATINPGIVLNPGNEIRTITSSKNMLAQAQIEETFDTKAGIFDISRFLATLSLFDDPDIEFGKDRFIVRSGRQRLSYTYTPESMIVTPGNLPGKVPSPDGTFLVSWADIESAIRSAGVLSLPEIAFQSDGEDVTMASVDTKNPTADTFSVTIAEGVNLPTFRRTVGIDFFKLLPRDYKITTSQNVISFESDTVQYWVTTSQAK